MNTANGNFHISLTADIIDSPPVKLPVKVDSPPPVKNHAPVMVAAADTVHADTAKFHIDANGDTIFRKTAIDSFSLYKISRDTLSGPVVYHADDSMVLDVPTKKMYLYGKISSIKYTDNELTAPEIEYDQATSLVRAHLKRDSTGKVISFVSYNQGEGFKSVMDSIVLNMKTLKGLTKGTYTQQGEIFVSGKTIKKVGKDVFYALDSKFTTCNLDTPHFAFVSHKIKFISGKMAFSGPVHPEFEGVPVPIVLPFGIYPLATGRHSGLLAPSFAASDQYGISLENLGYYKVFSPNWDLITRGTIYSYGGWTVNFNPRYYKRYHYQGNLSVNILKTKPLDLPSSRTINITWSHVMDTKARPGVAFTASVNGGSTKYNSLVPNNAALNYTNHMQSTIQYSKTWKDKPFSIIVAANHNQNTSNGYMEFNVPDIAFTVQPVFPFRRKEEVIGEYKWFENISVGLSTGTKTSTFFYDTARSKPLSEQIKDNFRWGARHDVPISLSLPPVGVVQLAPAISYSERWYMEQYFKVWNPDNAKVDTIIRNGFYTAREMSFGLSASTRIFGMYTFNNSSKTQIRHEIRPSLSVSYKPDFGKDSYYKAQIDAAKDSAIYSKYERSSYGSVTQGAFGGLSFSIDNNISMKTKNKKDTTTNGGFKKITLIDGLRLDGNYNFMADSFKLSTLQLSARSNLFDKVSITAGATLDPYQRDLTGRRIDKLIWANKPISLGELTSGTVSLQSGFKGGDKSKRNTSEAEDLAMRQQNANAIGVPITDYEQEAAYIRNNPGEFVDFNIPWSVDFSYSLRYGRSYDPITFNRNISLNQDITFNGSINLTPKWKLGMNGSFNITEKELGLISMYLSREMHCWQMTINISRSDQSRYFTINISPKSPMLRDLKVNRTRYFIGN